MQNTPVHICETCAGFAGHVKSHGRGRAECIQPVETGRLLVLRNEPWARLTNPVLSVLSLFGQ